MRIKKEKWIEAQQEERKQHTLSLEDGISHYAKVYENYFRFLGMDKDQRGKRIIEIGCADFPALHFCSNYTGIIIEPMPSRILRRLIVKNGILLVPFPAEESDFPLVDEVWLFNVLQHTIDPDSIIIRAKEASKVVRFFEPIGMPEDKCHLHSFTLDFFRQYFGNSVKHYIAEEGVKNFHTNECAYGTWHNQ